MSCSIAWSASQWSTIVYLPDKRYSTKDIPFTFLKNYNVVFAKLTSSCVIPLITLSQPIIHWYYKTEILIIIYLCTSYIFIQHIQGKCFRQWFNIYICSNSLSSYCHVFVIILLTELLL